LSFFERFILEDWKWDLEGEMGGVFAGGRMGEISRT